MKSVGQRADRAKWGGGVRGHPYHPLPLEFTTLWGNLEFQSGTRKFHEHWPFLGHESLLIVPGTLGSKSRSLESKQWPWFHRTVEGLSGEIIMTFGQTVALWWPQKDFALPAGAPPSPKHRSFQRGKYEESTCGGWGV